MKFIKKMLFTQSENYNFRKKAQVSSQIFVYILAIIVIGLIVLVGYKAIGTILKFTTQASLDDFVSDFTSEVKTISRSHGKVKRYEFTLQDKYDTICFMDSMNDDDEYDEIILPDDTSEFIKNIVIENVPTNVFLLKKGVPTGESFYVKDLNVATDYTCIVNEGLLEVWFEGTGKKACLMLEQTESCE